MGYENMTVRKRQKEGVEYKAFERDEKPGSLEERIQRAVDNVPKIIKENSVTLLGVANNLISNYKFSSDRLKNMGEEKYEELEELCDPCDPAVIIALVQYFEVNKKELETIAKKLH